MTPSVEAPTRGPSVIAGGIQRLSVSQLKKHKLCPRAWFFQKVMRLPEPTAGAQQVGTEGHAQLEHYLSTGEDVLGTFAKAGAHLLPTPGPDLLVEQPLDGAPPLTAGGIPFTGFIDLVDARHLASDGVLRITDHKFTSNIASNAASAEQLANANTEPGLQMVGYGAWALGQVERFPGLHTLELEHLYYQTRGQRLAVSVVASVPFGHVAREWRTKVEPQVEAMKAHARAADVPANFGPANSRGYDPSDGMSCDTPSPVICSWGSAVQSRTRTLGTRFH
ncbi:PD-(D/E)XK nuclease family protein [Corallococcus terminator]